MTKKLQPVDVVVVGFGWTGAIMSVELADAGLEIVALERGEYQDTSPDFAYPKIADELKYSVRGKLFQPLAKETVTVRHKGSDRAVPYREYGSFLLGNNVGGAGVHWNGMTWRPTPYDLTILSSTIERYGKSAIPDDMCIQDFGITYEELEPFFDQFEYTCGTSGQAGNLNGQITAGGNPFEAPRSRNYPTPPVTNVYGADLFAKAAKELGYSPFPIPASNASEPYTNPYEVTLGPCNLCGFCEGYGCFMYSKASPQTTILPNLMKRPNFTLRTNSQVIKINLDSTGKKATGVTYIDAQGHHIEQPANMVVVAAFQMHNVRLMLMSGIGKPYNPSTGEGVIGKNYAYQILGGGSAFFDQNTHTNPFIGAGAGGFQAIDDFNSDNFDHSGLGFIGGGVIYAGQTGGRPIQQLSVPEGTPAWGVEWKKTAKANYLHATGFGSMGSVMAYKDAYLDLDPTYKDANGLPLLRITFNWHDNEYKMTKYVTEKAIEVIQGTHPINVKANIIKVGDDYDVRHYQSTHNTGGVIMGSSPENSAVNKYLQSWDVPNLFVLGASAFPQNFGYNPTGLVGALTFYAAKGIRDIYLKNPGPMVAA